MKRLRLALATLYSLSVITLPGLAQQAATDNLKLSKQFRDGFLRGCVTGKTPAVKNQTGYCTCLANSYLSRYDGTSLNTISQLSGTLGENGVRLVNMMMTPEARSCAAKSR
jgi:hypothetical protein